MMRLCRYDVMSQCWYENPAHRPAFSVIRQQLDLLLGHHRNYLDLDNLDMSPAPATATVGDRCSGTMSPLPMSVRLVYDVDDDDDEDREGEDSYVDSNPLVGEGESPSSRTSVSSSRRNLENGCIVWRSEHGARQTDFNGMRLSASCTLPSSYELNVRPEKKLLAALTLYFF